MTRPAYEADRAAARRRSLGPLYVLGLLLLNFGVVLAMMMTMNHVKQQPPEPLGFDLTLRTGYGGFIAYGVAAAVGGVLLMLAAPPRRNGP